MQEKHHPNSPSTLALRKNCPYSGVLEPQCKSTSNKYSIEGVLLHKAMETSDFSKLSEEQADLCTFAMNEVNQIIGDTRPEFVAKEDTSYLLLMWTGSFKQPVSMKREWKSVTVQFIICSV
jgi:hypothetical protein